MLENDSALGSLEDDICARVPLFELQFYLTLKVIVLVFGFPESTALFPKIEQRSIDDNAMSAVLLDGILRDQRPVHLFGVPAKDGLKGTAHCGLVFDIEVAVLAKDGVVVLDELVGRL
jgi:hypothetical protein